MLSADAEFGQGHIFVVVVSGHVNHLTSIQHVFHLLKIRLKPQKPPKKPKTTHGFIRGLEEHQ